MKAPKIEQMRKRVTVQRYTTTVNADGFRTGTWQDYKTVWARVKPTSGRGDRSNDKFSQDITYDVTVRAPLEVTFKDKLVFEGRELTIDAVLPFSEGRNFWLQLVCTDDKDKN